MIADLMVDLYVSVNGLDTNPGTRDAPFQTIARGAEAAKPGATVHVAPGVYEGGFQTTKSGAPEAPIRYVSEVKWGARIVPRAGNDKMQAWDNRGAHVVIDGFEVDGSQPNGGVRWLYGIYTTGSGSVVQNTKVHDIVRDAAAMNAANSGGQGGAGIMGDSYFGGADITVRNNVVYNIGPAATTTGLVHGIYMASSGQVLNNLVYQAAGDGISTWHDANALRIVNNTVVASHTGILIGGGDYYHRSGPHDHSQIRNNLVYDCNKGIEEGGGVGLNNVYTNNLVYGNRANWQLKRGKPANTVSADPKFLNYIRAGGGDYRLGPGSPAIDAGDGTGAPATDLEGVSRPQSKGIDIGAFEHVPPDKVPRKVAAGSR